MGEMARQTCTNVPPSCSTTYIEPPAGQEVNTSQLTNRVGGLHSSNLTITKTKIIMNQ